MNTVVETSKHKNPYTRDPKLFAVWENLYARPWLKFPEFQRLSKNNRALKQKDFDTVKTKMLYDRVIVIGTGSKEEIAEIPSITNGHSAPHPTPTTIPHKEVLQLNEEPRVIKPRVHLSDANKKKIEATIRAKPTISFEELSAMIPECKIHIFTQIRSLLKKKGFIDFPNQGRAGTPSTLKLREYFAAFTDAHRMYEVTLESFFKKAHGLPKSEAQVYWDATEASFYGQRRRRLEELAKTDDKAKQLLLEIGHRNNIKSRRYSKGETEPEAKPTPVAVLPETEEFAYWEKFVTVSIRSIPVEGAARRAAQVMVENLLHEILIQEGRPADTYQVIFRGEEFEIQIRKIRRFLKEG